MKGKQLIAAGAIVAFCVVLGLTAFAASHSKPASNLVQRYDLPAYADMGTGIDASAIDGLQVVQKAQELGLATLKAGDLQTSEQALVADLEAQLGNDKSWHGDVPFDGTTASELQDAIDANPGKLVSITSSALEIDQTVYLRNDTHVQGNGVRLNCTVDGAAFRGDDVSDVSLTGMDFAGPSPYGVLFDNSDYVRVSECNFRGLASKAILVMGDTDYFKISSSTFRQNRQGAIMVAGDSSYGLIENNTVKENEGFSDWMAGIVLTNLSPSDPEEIWQQFPDDPPHSASRDSLAGSTRAAHDVVVRNNTVHGNTSTGIYCDGAYSCYLYGNSVTSNDKEGLCLDYGTVSCRVHDNEFVDNGRRARQSDDSLAMDGVLDFGKLDDGSAVAKLPGVSLDNAAYNQVEANQVGDNWGGGVKVVCTGVRNVVAGNAIHDNNRGKNSAFSFPGVELGSAEGSGAGDMDYAPSYQNIVVGNAITGSHYAGVLIGNDGAGNKVGENTVKDQERYAIASDSRLPNDLSGNRYSGYVYNRAVLPL